MAQHVVLLRGVNLVRTNRVPMAKLRLALQKAGFGNVKTYVQSGNIVLSSRLSPDRVSARVHTVIKKEFGHDITVVVRSHTELKAVVKRNPLGKLAKNPKRHLVTFLGSALPAAVKKKLAEVAVHRERFAVRGKEIYSWHPEGVGRSPLWERLGGKALGVTATSRNWSTVTTLLAMSEDVSDR
jgi:uncharacterized protein (DUF1697 family)